MALMEGFVETNINGKRGVVWVNATGETKEMPQTRKRPIIAGLGDQNFHKGALLIYFHEGVTEPQEIMPTAVGLNAQAFATLSRLYSGK